MTTWAAAELLQRYDADGDGVEALEYGGEDCDDNDASLLGTSNDADCDGSLTADDCDDGDSANFPGNTEVCDGADNDCDGDIDDDDDSLDSTSAVLWYSDTDADGYGDPDSDQWSSYQPDIDGEINCVNALFHDPAPGKAKVTNDAKKGSVSSS